MRYSADPYDFDPNPIDEDTTCILCGRCLDWNFEYVFLYDGPCRGQVSCEHCAATLGYDADGHYHMDEEDALCAQE